MVYGGKQRQEDILAETLGVPLQAIRTFGQEDEPIKSEKWTNRLVFGDNLQAMKTMLDDPQVKGKVKLIYIDPPFATKQEFSSNRDQKAYQDKVIGARFLEFLRRRLVLLSKNKFGTSLGRSSRSMSINGG